MLFTERKPFLLNIALILALLAGFLGAVPTKAAQKEFSSSRNFFDSNRALSLDEGESELLTLQQPDANIETGANSVVSLQNFSAPFFEPYVNIPVGDAYAVGMGDFNNDGFRDVAITTDTQLMILLQNSDGSLANSVTYAAGSSPYSLAVGDLNNDGRDDVVVANYFGNTLSVFPQQSDGTFASRLIYSTSSGPDSVVVGDVNSDGLADITVAHWTAANIGVFTQAANGTLNAMVTYTSPQAGRDDISIADVNNDGRNDVIKMNGQGFNPSLSVYLQNANSSLAAPQSYSVTNCGFFCLSHGLGTGDVTGDGLTDIVLSYGGNTPNSKIAVFAQGQDGSLGSPVAYDAYDLPEPVEVSDVNNDGLADVLVAHSGWNALSVFTQQNGGVLDPYSLYTIPFGHYKPQGLAVGDINHDGLSDVAIADDNNGLVLLYQTLTPPNTPTPTSTPSATPTPSLTFTPSSTPTRMPTPIWLFISGNTGVGSTTLSFSTGVSITSDENGDYSYAIPFGWTGQIYPSKPGYRFTPVYQSYNSVQSDLSNQNFIAERVYTISGNAGHPGATLNYMEGGISKTAFTLGNGNYSFQVPEHWSGTVVPSMPDYIFTPASKSYSDVQADQTSQDYTAIQSIMTISGDVRHSGVTLSYVENGVLKTATSNSNGSYFFKVNSGWSGTVTPSKAGVIFDPVSKSYSNVQSNQTAQNYKASIPVTNLADSGSGSLRQAISSAVYGDVITFHPDLAGQTITLASIINIGTGLTINGLGLNPRVEISGNSAVGIFGVDPRFDPSGGPRDVKFQSLILKNANTAIGIGGGNVFIEDVSFIGNTAYDGGAISSCCFNTTITITRSDFTSNSAQHYGGAIRTQFGSLTVRSSTFTNNSAGSVGGAISIERQGPYTFEDNTFSNNNALSGGAIAFESIEEPIIIRRNLFSNNSVSLNGGAIFELFAESFLIENNTFFGNQANDSGGGISISSTATIRNNTFSNNRALQNGASLSLGAAYLYNNILANNTGGGECNIRSAGWVVGSNNLIEGGSTNCAATITGNPMLGPLADNGGSTKTMALLHGSPAIDTGNGVHCPATDQRGVARPLGNGCDIGAFEYVPLYLSLTGNQTNGGVTSADEDILRFDGKNWSLFFDGSDVGVGNSDLFGFSIVDADTILMAFNTSFTLNGMSVTPRDVLQFDATSLGSNTAGTFSMYINGIDVGLDVAAENIDSIGLLPDGRVLLSTTGNPVVTGITGGRDEDVLAFTPTSLGNNTSGSWSLYFDGSDTGLGETSGEDVDGLDITSNGNIYLSTAGDFTAGGIIGADEDVFVCVPTSLGNVTSCNYLPVLYFDGSIWGLTTNDVDALNLFAANTIQTIPPTSTPTPTFTPITTSTRTPTITPTFTRTPTPTATSTSGSQVLPDLMISSMRIELQNTSCLMPGDPMGVRVWVTNSDQAAAGSFVVNVNGVTQTVNGLAINETKAVFFSGAGNPVSAIVDSTNIVLESNEDNNARSETLPVPTPPLPCPTLTPSPTFTPTIIPSFTNTPGGSDLIFADGFESGGFSAWSSNTNDAGDLNVSAAAALVGTRGMQTLIDDAKTIYVTDDTPNAETRYRVRFYFDPNSITMASGDAHFIFKAFMGTGTDVLQVEFRNWAGAYQIRGKVLNDASAFVVTNWVAISDAPHFIEVDWVASTGAGANNGGLTLRLDGFQQAALTGVDNDTSRIDRVRLGALAGMDAGTNGIYYFDAFESRRQNYIGP